MLNDMVVGFVRASHGLSGEFRVESASGRYEHIAVLKEVTLRGGGAQKLYNVDYTKVAGDTLYMKLAGVDSRDAIQKYKGYELVVPRENATSLQKDEWYIEDIKECSLIYKGKDGKKGEKVVGYITNVVEGGGGYVLEVSASEVETGFDKKHKTVFVPFNDMFIGCVDMKNKTVELMHRWILE